MRRTLIAAIAVSAIAVSAIAIPAHAAAPITGQWVTQSGNAIVTIEPCGASVCGKISKIIRPDPKGNGTDQKNPEPQLRSRPVLGLQIIPSFTDAGKDWRGQIYSPEAGRSYKGYLSRQADGSLKVTGCIAAFLCQNQKWTPAK
ncbi:MAG: DUF2147 domain-containing protein [Sphingomonas sp.]